MAEEIDLDGFNLDLETSALNELPSIGTSFDPSTDFVSWIDEVETLLMADEVDNASLGANEELVAGFLSDILVDSPVGGLGTGEEFIDRPVNCKGDVAGDRAVVEKVCEGNSESISNDSGCGTSGKKSDNAYNCSGSAGETVANAYNRSGIAGETVANKDGKRGHEDDPATYKRKRQMRNRDAALRSRERKKVYLRDLEMKSKYLEGECMRLGRLLQCFVAENQALRLCLHGGSTENDATAPKQESAVLLWESLLLGSLLWSLGIMCLFPLIELSRPTLAPLLTGVLGVKNGAQRSRESKMCELERGESFVKGRKCKASRMRMKVGSTMFYLRVSG